MTPPAPAARPRLSPRSPSRYALRPSRRQPRCPLPGRSGKINTNNNRHEVGPLQASVVGPLQTAAARRFALEGRDITIAELRLAADALDALPDHPSRRHGATAGSVPRSGRPVTTSLHRRLWLSAVGGRNASPDSSFLRSARSPPGLRGDIAVAGFGASRDDKAVPSARCGFLLGETRCRRLQGGHVGGDGSIQPPRHRGGRCNHGFDGLRPPPTAPGPRLGNPGGARSGSYALCPGIQLVPASGTRAIAAASMVRATRSSGSRLWRCDLPHARASVCASRVSVRR
jgi:hypothetical protein